MDHQTRMNAYLEENCLAIPPCGPTQNGELICLPQDALGADWMVLAYVDGSFRVVHKNYFSRSSNTVRPVGFQTPTV